MKQFGYSHFCQPKQDIPAIAAAYTINLYTRKTTRNRITKKTKKYIKIFNTNLLRKGIKITSQQLDSESYQTEKI